MSKTLTPSTAVTSRDNKGRKFLDKVAAIYDKRLLKEVEAQRINEADGLDDVIEAYIERHRYEVPPILKLVDRDIKIAGAKCFVAKDAFTRENGCYVWDSFKANFLDKVEENISDVTLAIHRLEKSSLDAQIRKELGPEREEITLTHFFNLLRKAGSWRKTLLACQRLREYRVHP